jgi:predicted secreted protein
MRHHVPTIDWPQMHRLHDEAVHRARALRAEAMDDFWRGLGDALAGQRLAARRAAHRFAQRLERHLRERSATQAGCTPG